MILKSILFAAASAVAAFPAAASFTESQQADDRVVRRVASQNGRAVVERAKAFLARLRRSPGDLVAGPGQDWKFPAKPSGIVAKVLSPEQRKLLRSAIALYVRDAEDTSAAKIQETDDRELDHTYLSFGGSSELAATGDYVRIDGPSVWIELIMDGPWSFSDPHPHSVWRDKRTDYGGTKR